MSIQNIITLIGISAIMAALIYIGRKLQVLDTVEKKVESLDKTLELLSNVKVVNPTNAYDAEQTILNVVSDITKNYPDIVPRLKDGAFRVGQGTETVLLVGGFFLRDLIFSELGFSLIDLDKPKAV